MLDVFISRPSLLDPKCEAAYQHFEDHLSGLKLRARRLGKTDYARKAPLKEVINLITKCQGAIIMGYPQVVVSQSVVRGTKISNMELNISTPWNQIEGALAYSANIPVLVVAQTGVEGGIFDYGVTGEMVLHINLAKRDWHLMPSFQQPLGNWFKELRNPANR